MDIGKYMIPKKSRRTLQDDNVNDDASVSSSRSLSSLWRRSKSKKNDVSDDKSTNSSRSFGIRGRSSLSKGAGGDDDGAESSLLFRKKRADKSPKRDKQTKKTKKTKGPDQDKTDDEPVEEDSKDLKASSSRNDSEHGSVELNSEKKAKKKKKGDIELTTKTPKGKKKKKAKLVGPSDSGDSDQLMKSPKGKKKKKKGSPSKSIKKTNSSIDEGDDDRSGHPDADDADNSLHPDVDEDENGNSKEKEDASAEGRGGHVEEVEEGEEGSVGLNDTNDGADNGDGAVLIEGETEAAEPTKGVEAFSNLVPPFAVESPTRDERKVEKPVGNDGDVDQEEAKDTVPVGTPTRKQSKLGALFRRNSISPSSVGSPTMSPGTLKKSIIKLRRSISKKGTRSNSMSSTGAVNDADRENPGVKKRFSQLWLDEKPLGLPDLDDDDEGNRMLDELKADNEQLRAQLDWSLQQLEELNEKELQQKNDTNSLKEKYELLQKEHKANLELVDNLKHFVQNQESKLMEKDMQIMTLEESVHGGADEQSYQEGFMSLKSGSSRKPSLPQNIDVPDTNEYNEVDSDIDEMRSAKSEIVRGPRSHRSGSPMRPARDRSLSPVRSGSDGLYGWSEGGVPKSPRRNGSVDLQNLRNKRRLEELEDQIVSKDQLIEEMKAELEEVKDKLEQVDYANFAKENKSLREEVARLKGLNTRKGNASDSGSTDSSGDDDSEPRGMESTEFHRHLTEEGISPTLDLEKNAREYHDSRVSILSCGDQSYIADLENQAETVDDRRREALLEEAQERYEKELEEKGLSENEDLFLEIFTSLLEEEKESIQKEHKFFSDKLDEMKKRKRFSRITDDNLDALSLENLRVEAGNGKSFDYEALVADLEKANERADTTAEELKIAKEQLVERDVELVNLQRALDESRDSSNRFFGKNLRGELNEQKSMNKLLKDELHQARVKLVQMEEKLISMKEELDKIGEEQDWVKRLKDLEKELETQRFENKELKLDLTVAKAEVEELRDSGSQKPYFSRPSAVETENSDLSSKTSTSGGTTRSGGMFGFGFGGSNHKDDDDEGDNGSKLNGYVKNYFGSKPPTGVPLPDSTADDDDDKEGPAANKKNVLNQMMGSIGGGATNAGVTGSNGDPSTPKSPGKEEEGEMDLNQSISMLSPISRFFGGGRSEPQSEMKDNSAHGSTSSGLFSSLYGSKSNHEAQKSAIELS